jgi:uncharacterized membrane protein YdjX (TVP38/TMEM64 family)
MRGRASALPLFTYQWYNHCMKRLVNTLLRMLAVFAESALAIIGAGSLFGVETYKAALMAGAVGVSTVIVKLSRAFLQDGRLTVIETNEAFSAVDSHHDIADHMKD